MAKIQTEQAKQKNADCTNGKREAHQHFASVEKKSRPIQTK